MTALALALVLSSALAHATWNLLVKRAINPQAFTLWLLLTSSVLLLPVVAVVAWRYPVVGPGWWFILGTASIHVLYFTFLSRAYAAGDLSLVYPIARGMGPMLAPAMGVLLLKERIAPLAMVGIAAVVVGIYTVHWAGRLRQLRTDPLGILKQKGTRYAILTGLVIAAYSVWDKQGVKYVHPLFYMYMLHLGAMLGYGPLVLRTVGLQALRVEWRANAWRTVLAGLLTFLAYVMVLTALQTTRVSYVSPAREVGIAFAVLLGIVVLKEPFGRGRLLGAAFILAGLVLIALSP